MAIPFASPSEDGAQSREQQLEQLMFDLYTLLQQILRSRIAQHPSRNHRSPRRAVSEPSNYREHPVILLESDLTQMSLPNLVLSVAEQLQPPLPQVTVSAPNSPTRDAAFQFPEYSTPVPSPRPKPRRRRVASESALVKAAMKTNDVGCTSRTAKTPDETEWATVGTNLRNIADDFQASKTKDSEVVKSRLPIIGSTLTSGSISNTSSCTDGILSLLIPAPIRGTLWTTIALYLGWRLVSRLR